MVDWLQVVTDEFFQVIKHLDHASSSACSYVKKISRGISFSSKHICPSHVFDMGHVHGLGAVSKNRNGLPISHEVVPPGHNLRVGTLNVLPCSVNVKISERNKRQPMLAMEIAAELF